MNLRSVCTLAGKPAELLGTFAPKSLSPLSGSPWLQITSFWTRSVWADQAVFAAESGRQPHACAELASKKSTSSGRRSGRVALSEIALRLISRLVALSSSP